LALGHLVPVQSGRRLRKHGGEVTLRGIRPTRRNELFYRRQLALIVSQLRAVTHDVSDELRRDWPAPRAKDGSAADASGPSITDVLRRAAVHFGDIEGVARRLTDVRNRLSLVRRNLASVDEALIASVRQAVGVDITGALHDGGRVQAEMAKAARENVELITSIPAQHLERVRVAVEKAFADGTRWESMAKELREIGDITDRRARIIARDQTAKMNSAFNQARQTEVGITRYRWSGALDARERASHRALEGTVHRWDSPPMVDGQAAHPGFPIMCRCVAQPVIDVLSLSVEPAAVAA
jgi:SPP1 gp7 family putative phage head morphogenesis protein